MDKTWIGTDRRSAIFPPSAWTVFKRPFRTNNDLEGQNNRLKKYCRGKKLHLYRFLIIIDNEFKSLSMNVTLATEKKLAKIRKRNEMLKDSKIQQLTIQYQL